MSIWQVLEIEATDDIKSIKRAYAKKLKVTRPDEDPKGFQELHQAYKTALHYAEWTARRVAAEAENQVESNDDQLVDSEQQEQEHKPIDPTEPEYTHQTLINTDTILTEPKHSNAERNHSSSEPQQPTADNVSFDLQLVDDEVHDLKLVDEEAKAEPVNPYQQEGERLLGIAQLLLTSNGDQAKEKSWSFLLASPYILEDHFNWRLGLELLTYIREHNLNHAAQVHKLVGQEVMTYLDSIFNWNINRNQILRTLGDDYETWLDMIRDPQESQVDWQDKIRGGKNIQLATEVPLIEKAEFQIAHPIRRFAAYLIDTLLILFAFLLMRADAPLPPQWGLPILSILYFWFFEASLLQGSIGKRLLGLRVVSEKGEGLSAGRCLIRCILFYLYQTIFFIAIGFVALKLRIFVLALIGLYIYKFMKNPSPYYDTITKTRVVVNG